MDRGDDARMKSSQDQMDSTRGSGSDSSINSTHDSISGERSGMQHTNAGNTGTGSGQISPVTQHPHDESRDSGGPLRSAGGSRHNR
jgi:hypothetical protein